MEQIKVIHPGFDFSSFGIYKRVIDGAIEGPDDPVAVMMKAVKALRVKRMSSRAVRRRVIKKVMVELIRGRVIKELQLRKLLMMKRLILALLFKYV